MGVIGILNGLFGIAVGGIISYYFYNKSKKYVLLTFEIKESYSTKSGDENFNYFDIRYNGYEIKNSAIVFRGRIINKGNLDLPTSSVHSLNIELPNPYELLDFKYKSDFFTIDEDKLNKNKLSIKLNKFLKVNESIEFELIAQTNDEVEKEIDSKIFYDSIIIEQNIENVNKITKIPYRVDNKTTSQNKIKIWVALTVILLFFFVGTIIGTLSSLSENNILIESLQNNVSSNYAQIFSISICMILSYLILFYVVLKIVRKYWE